jgi:DNA-binding LacI/PurR family transcriptional regulator
LGKTAAELLVARLSGEEVGVSQNIEFEHIPGETVKRSNDK